MGFASFKSSRTSEQGEQSEQTQIPNQMNWVKSGGFSVFLSVDFTPYNLKLWIQALS